jgi:hypothetical protein
MRWFKHLAASGRDEKISALRDALGNEGIGMYWTLLETIAEQMDESDKCQVVLSLAQWASRLYCHSNKAKRFFHVIGDGDSPLVEIITDSKKWLVRIPNLLKYRDNYSKNLQVKDKKETTKKQVAPVAPEVKLLKRELLSFFEDLWGAYPRKDGKKGALRHYNASVKTDEDMDRINKALEAYLSAVNGKDPQFIKKGETWFNNWADWEPKEKGK